MVLATHGVIGASIGLMMRTHPVLSFLFGFLSHFLLDSIAHWDYFHLLNSFKKKSADKKSVIVVFSKKTITDVLIILFDCILGFVVAFYFYQQYFDNFTFSGVLSSGIFWGAFGGVMPDFLQFVYFIYKREPLISLKKFHEFCHSKKSLKKNYLLGPLLQFVFVGVVISIYSIFY